MFKRNRSHQVAVLLKCTFSKCTLFDGVACLHPPRILPYVGEHWPCECSNADMGTPVVAYFTVYFQGTSNGLQMLVMAYFVLKHKVIIFFLPLLSEKGGTVYHKLGFEIISLYGGDLF